MDNYKEIYHVYQKCIRIVVDDFLPKTPYKFIASPEFLAVEGAQYNQNANFEAVTNDDRPVKVLKVVYHSIRNLRKNIHIDANNKRLQAIAAHMKRTSYLSELEFFYTYALHAKTFTISEGTPFFNLMNDYIDHFYDKHDVLEDLRPYFKLLTAAEDAQEMLDRMRKRLE